MIRFDRLSYRYPHQNEPALHAIDLAIDAGDFVLVTGPSGAGKSTLVRAINGLVPHFHGGAFGGRVLVAGIDTRETSPAALSRVVGFVAQDPEAQTVTDRVEDEIAFGLENHGLERREIRLRVEETLDLLGITGLRDREPASLSGGERQRVAIAAAMATHPATLVLDEPTSQLDPWAAEEVLTVLERLNAELGTTIVLVEHRLERVLGWANRLLVLDAHGGLAAFGTTQNVAGGLPSPPPVVRLGHGLGWEPIPLTVRDARRARDRFRPDPNTLPPPAEIDLPQGYGDRTVEFNHVTFAYGKRTVLRNLSVAFTSGSVTALMGRNGSGKTTVLKHVIGLLRPAAGTVHVLGSDIRRRDPADLAGTIGYLPQRPAALLFNETVAKELAFSMHAQHRAGDVPGVLERLGLTGLADRSPFDLAGGERQRAALAAVLITDPPILLLDEPTRGMDDVWKRQLGRLLRDMADHGATIVIATHDVELVAATAHRVIVLGNGEVVADGSPRDVLSGSLTFAPQTNRIFGGRFLTPEDVLGPSSPEHRSEHQPAVTTPPDAHR